MYFCASTWALLAPGTIGRPHTVWQENLYDVLGVDKNASEQEIKKARHGSKRIWQNHPTAEIGLDTFLYIFHKSNQKASPQIENPQRQAPRSFADFREQRPLVAALFLAQVNRFHPSGGHCDMRWQAYKRAAVKFHPDKVPLPETHMWVARCFPGVSR